MTDRSPVLEKMYAFNAPAASLDEMVRAGFNLFSLANNHMADAGPGGIADTEAHLRRLDAARGPLHWAGAGSRRDAVHFRVPGHPQRIAFLALGNDAGVARFEEGAAVAAVRAAAKKADIVLVSVHKGVEYDHRPPAELVRGYRRLIEAGATVVLGHHPHVVQGIEAYQTGLIFYSLGNYSLASKTVRHRRTGAKLFGMLPTLSFRGSRPVAARITPLYVNNLEPLTSPAARYSPPPRSSPSSPAVPSPITSLPASSSGPGRSRATPPASPATATPCWWTCRPGPRPPLSPGARRSGSPPGRVPSPLPRPPPCAASAAGSPAPAPPPRRPLPRGKRRGARCGRRSPP